MADFFVRRLPVVADERRYHLLDDQDQIVLVADYRSPWQRAAAEDHVRLGRADGKLVASLDMTNTPASGRRGRPENSYAIIHDYAVYGILNQYRDEGEGRPSFTLEVEGQRWLALGQEGNDRVYALYARAPEQMGRQMAFDASGLPDPVGSVTAQAGGYDYAVTLPVGSLRQRELVSLALVFLIDSS